MILLDTHAALWLATDPSRISPRASTAIKEARSRGEALSISGITLLELSTLARKGRVHLNVAPEEFLQLVENAFSVLPITARACARILAFPSTFPKDPGDRIIVATALVEGLVLITADREISRSKLIRTIW